MIRFAAKQLFINRNFSTKFNEISNLVKKNKVVVFMKGIPEEPRCGFSNAVVQILRMHGVTYDAHDVLKDEELRQGIKDFSNWPTIPQIFINGDFVGGCDILLEMHKNGDLIEELKKAGITSALLEKEDSSQSGVNKSKE
ncbi:Glutaredoxin-related protein 5, mitochondrial [Atta colombica]|uniref:Glutaredoxin-related protein 5, mitochondrial n=1 Tax=Atta colombica TaxID=520822 RepID=A0A195BR33_9HYME|nr:PREDICTED: glutaredoxin-related protein 5, mitochondrial [Atta colombica]KYM88421.1 Glutaredoxin-related protein 5, mitochondrial [Atta colombica]